MTTFFFIAGLAAVTAGAALIFLPAGLIVGGAMLAWVAWSAEPGDLEPGEPS